MLTLDGMEVLQIRMMEIHLRFAAETGQSIGVNPTVVRKTVAYWFDRIGHKGVPARAKWTTLHAEWKEVFAAVLAE
jgi:hypothetical protein